MTKKSESPAVFLIQTKKPFLCTKLKKDETSHEQNTPTDKPLRRVPSNTVKN